MRNLSKRVSSNRDEKYDHLPSMKEEDIGRRAEFASSILERLNNIDRTGMSQEDLISLELFQFIQEDIVESYKFKAHY